MAEQLFPRGSRRLRQHLRPYGETMSAYPALEIAGATDVDPALRARSSSVSGALPTLARRPARGSGRGRGRQPDLPQRPRRGHRRRTRRRQARPQREAARVELRGGASRWSSSRDANGVRLSCSPITFMGDAQETAWRLVAAGAIGTVRVAYAEVNWGRIETWHPRPRGSTRSVRSSTSASTRSRS